MKKVFVKNCDYDRYSITLPLKIAIRRHGKAFLFKELEKRHPCFSLGCCTDTHYVFRGGKLTAEVTVMDRCRLAEYRKLNPGRKLYLEGEPFFAVFKTQGEKIKIAAFCLLLLFGGISLIFVNRNHNEVAGDKVFALPASSLEKNESPVAPDSYLLAPTEIFGAVFSSIKDSGGKISSFVWENGEACMSIRGCNIEEIAGARSCVVSYKNDEPYFSLVLKTSNPKTDNFSKKGKKNLSAQEMNKSLDFSPERQMAEFEKTMFVPQIRTMLRTEGVDLVSEYRSEDFVELSFSVKNSSLAKAFKYCAGLSSGNGWRENSLSIEGGEKSCAVKVSFVPEENQSPSEVDAGKSPLMQAFLFSEIFLPEAQDFNSPALKTNKPSLPAVSRLPFIGGEKVGKTDFSDSQGKIGEIRRKDGSIFVYYRNRYGQLNQEVKKNGSIE